MKPNNLTSNRILYFDYLEVLAIFLVVSIHPHGSIFRILQAFFQSSAVYVYHCFSWLMVHYYFTDLSI